MNELVEAVIIANLSGSADAKWCGIDCGCMCSNGNDVP
jgi:hypothetical protein